MKILLLRRDLVLYVYVVIVIVYVMLYVLSASDYLCEGALAVRLVEISDGFGHQIMLNKSPR